MTQSTLDDIASTIVTKLSVKADKSQLMAKASVVEAEAGTDDNKAMTPATTKATVLKLAPALDINSIKQSIVDMLYPVGAVYISINNSFDPNTTLGGRWVKIENRFLLASGSKSVGATGGEENVTLNVNQIPPHNHDRGNMNITGEFYTCENDTYDNTASGAFVYNKSSVYKNFPWKDNNVGKRYTFDASRTWSGRTGETGGNQSHNNMPPYVVVDIWKREE